MPFSAGGPVHPTRQFIGEDRALGLPALYSGVRLLAESCAALPLKIYSKSAADTRTHRYTGPSIFDAPSATGTIFDWLFTAMTSLLLQGNAWGFITSRDGYGYPQGIEWLPPEDVAVVDDEMQPWNPLRTRIYAYGRLIDRQDLFHIKAFSLPGRTEGISVLRAFALTILSGLEAERYGTDWYASGGFPPGTFQNQELEISEEQASEIRSMLVSSLRNRQPLVYGRDWDYKPVVVPPSEAQFIEALRMNATQIASVLGLPPDRIGGTRGDSLTYNCAMEGTEILTPQGWRTHDQVKAGDTALTLNTETGAAEWQPIESVHVFSDGPYRVIQLENQSHSSATTYDHRWPVTTGGRPQGFQWKTTSMLTRDTKICMAAPLAGSAEPKWSDALVELIAWFWTEGWIGASGAVTITQSGSISPQNVTRIRVALAEMFGPDVKTTGQSLLGSRGWQKRELIRTELARDPDRSNYAIAKTCGADRRTVELVRQGKTDGPGWTEDIDDRQMSHFRLNAQAGQVLTAHAPDKIVSTEFLSQLTPAQLELFYQVSVDADGHRYQNGRIQLGQKDPRRLESFQIACALTGRAATMPQQPNSRGMYYMSIQALPWCRPLAHDEYASLGEARLVWCVQTPNKTWFARRNGKCYFTGNTVEQSTLQVIEALRPWLVRLENAFFTILPQNRYCRFNSDALLKTDLKTRTEIYHIQRQMGMRSVDEIRDLEDLEPIPGGEGNENIPLEVMVAMARSIRGIPKSMQPAISLEMDLAADKLQELAGQGLAQPTPSPLPTVPSAEQELGQIVSSQRHYGADREERDDAELIWQFLEARRSRILATRQRKGGPEYVGAWIPDKRDLVLNGNGRH